MQVKGAGVKATYEFVKKKYPELFDKWLKSLPPSSYDIYRNPIYAGYWYDMEKAYTVPTEVLAQLLNKKPEEIAEEIGKYSAEAALSGIYSIFMRLASLKFVIDRIPQIFKTYYKPVYVKILDKTYAHLVVEFGDTNEREKLLFFRNKGWIVKFVEKVEKPNSINVELKVFQSPDNTKLYRAKFTIVWK